MKNIDLYYLELLIKYIRKFDAMWTNIFVAFYPSTNIFTIKKRESFLQKELERFDRVIKWIENRLRYEITRSLKKVFKK